MQNRYAYSLNGEDYVGAFETRSAAEAAALDAARFANEPPTTVYTARSVAAEPKLSGCARALISHLASRNGDNPANVGEAAISELDAELAKLLAAWLSRHQLIAAAWRVEAINEIPVPPALENHVSSDSDEVFDLGVSDALEASVGPH
jgi:hypothetical protein